MPLQKLGIALLVIVAKAEMKPKMMDRVCKEYDDACGDGESESYDNAEA
jgi:hypothetical protein